MSQRWRKLGAAVTFGISVASACTVVNPTNNPAPGDTTDQAGADTNPSAGKGTGGGGRGSQAGSSGKGGGGKAGGSANLGGAGGEANLAGQGAAPTGPDCSACASGACLSDGTCVDCVATHDECPSGQYCTDANVCEPGCKPDGTSCASGVCGADRNCENCISDDECLSGAFCGGGKCREPCTAEQENQSLGCEDDLVCCSLRCAELTTDSHNCGACGASCGDTQFCGVATCDASGEGGAGGGGSGPCVTCHDTALSSLCAVSKIVVILDTTKNETDGNRKPGRAIGAALAAGCPLQPTLTEAEQDSVAALNLSTGRPVSNSGELLVVAGGPFYQIVEGYLEGQKIAPLYSYGDADSSGYRRTSNDKDVVHAALTDDHVSHDFFIVQFMRDPASNSLILNVQGLWLSGTVAAAYQLTNVILPALETYDKAWYAFEWTDMDGDNQPDADEIALKASGD